MSPRLRVNHYRAMVSVGDAGHQEPDGKPDLNNVMRNDHRAVTLALLLRYGFYCATAMGDI